MAEVFVVEDDADLVYIYRTALAHAGHQVTMARSVSDAQVALRSSTPDLVFLDLNMPGEHGTALIHYIRSEERFRHTKIVVVTADHLMQRKIPTDDITGFLVKPVGIHDLIAIANQLTAAV